MAINNPYIPGDPFSYDLKWIISKIKQLDVVYDSIDAKIAEKIYQAFQESNLINFKTTEAMLQATLEDGAVVLTDGYHEPGDGGTMIYLIQGFTPEMCQLDYYLTLPGNKIAVPVVLFPYVTPIMFGAYGDGTADDTEAFKQALKMHKPVNLIAKSYKISDTLTIDEDLLTLSNGSILMPEEVSTGFLFIDNAENVTVREIKFTGSGAAMPTGSTGAYTAVRAEKANHLTVDNCSITNVSNGGIFVLESSYVTVSNNTVRGIANNDAYGAIVVGYGVNNADMGYQTIQNNTIDGGHFGIEVQGWQHDVAISGNKIRNNYGYGINIYRYELSASSKFTNVQVNGNLIENTHHNTNVGYYNGMGIYAQSIDKMTISNNILTNVLLDRPDSANPNRTLSPGAISITGSEEVTCTGNVINGSGIDGIDVVDVASTTVGNIISNNMITNVTWAGVYAQAVQNVLVSDNIFSGTADTGVTCLSHPVKESEKIAITGNMFNCSSAVSVTVNKGTGTLTKGITISGNTMTNFSYRAVGVSSAEDVILSNNMVLASGSVSNYAMYLDGITSGVITGNVVNGPASSMYGGWYMNNVNGSMFNGNFTKGLQTNNRMYQISDSDVTITNCMDMDHSVPYTKEFCMHFNPTVNGPHFLTGTGAPSTGTYPRGSVCFNTVAAANAPAYWVCVTAGTPGTWRPGPNL